MENIIEGVYIQIVEKKKVVQKYVPLSQVFISDKVTLGEHLKLVQAQIEALNKEVGLLKSNTERLENVFENTIRGFVTK